MEENDEKQALPSICQSMDDSMEAPEVPSLNKVKADIGRLLADSQKLVLEKIFALIEKVDPSNQQQLDQLISALKAIADIRLTEEWTTKLKTLILKKPGRLVPPGTSGNGPLNKLKGFYQKAAKEVGGDKRENIQRAKEETLEELLKEVDLPEEEN